jgi:hypothetical protein
LTDTVTFLNWGGDANYNGVADYLSIPIVQHDHDVDGGYLFV